jgi:small GTP-binding protein
MAPTLGMDFISLKFEINSETVKLHIWDTAGQERFKCVNNVYYQNALGAMLVVSI